MADVTVDGKKVSQEEVAKALALLEKTKEQRAKQRERNKNNPEASAKQKARATRQRVKTQLLLAKAVKAGITVTDKEIDDAIAKAAAVAPK